MPVKAITALRSGGGCAQGRESGERLHANILVSIGDCVFGRTETPPLEPADTTEQQTNLLWRDFGLECRRRSCCPLDGRIERWVTTCQQRLPRERGQHIGNYPVTFERLPRW